MLAKSWIYMIHNLIITMMTLGIIKQLFYIKATRKEMISYILWMQFVFVINDFILEANFPLQYKYILIFIGFSVGFRYLLNLSLIACTLVMVINLSINGIATNLNIFILLLNQFESYAAALKSDFIQYTSLVMMTSALFLMLKTFNVRILDISRYS